MTCLQKARDPASQARTLTRDPSLATSGTYKGTFSGHIRLVLVSQLYPLSRRCNIQGSQPSYGQSYRYRAELPSIIVSMKAIDLTRKPPGYVVAALVCSLGGFLFGMDTGIIGPVTVMEDFKRYVGTPSPTIHGLIVSSILIPAAISSFFAGRLADILVAPVASPLVPSFSVLVAPWRPVPSTLECSWLAVLSRVLVKASTWAPLLSTLARFHLQGIVGD